MVLLGRRRVGKSILIRHLIADLLEQSVASRLASDLPESKYGKPAEKCSTWSPRFRMNLQTTHDFAQAKKRRSSFQFIV